MPRFRNLCAVGTFFVWSVALAANESDCGLFKNPNDVLQCAIQRDKSLRVSEADVTIAEASVEIGRQRLNPDLEIESMRRKKGFSHGITLTHPFDLGGKRQAREKIAFAEKDAAVAELRKAREDVVLGTVVSLYRLRQIKKELEIVQEGISTFDQVARQFRKAGGLSPEQRISISIFNMALEDHRIREAALLSEQQIAIGQVSLAVGQTFEPDQKSLPTVQEVWPALKKASIDSSSVALAKAATAVAHAGYELQKSEAWPDMRLGPKVEIDEDRKTWIGFSLAVPLPLYHQGQGGALHALAQERRGELLQEKASAEAQSTYASLASSYQHLTSSLQRTLKSGGVETRHKDLHSLLKRGVVSASLITELHRQRQEYYDDFHEQELKAIEALWRIYALEGRADKEMIQ